jgi:hypothetical protein
VFSHCKINIECLISGRFYCDTPLKQKPFDRKLDNETHGRFTITGMTHGVGKSQTVIDMFMGRKVRFPLRRFLSRFYHSN